MLHIWGAIEADFLRDYRICLMERLDGMTWREFLVLLKNLAPNGAVAARVSEEAKTKETNEKDDESAANDFFSSILSSY